MKNQTYFRFGIIFIFLYFALVGAGIAQTETFNRLLAEARETGAVRIIVGVKIADGFAPEGDLADRHKPRAARCDSARAENLLDQISNFRVVDVKQFEFIPFLAFEIDAAGLELLKYLPDVTSISEDLIVEPTLAESLPIVGASAVWNAGASGTGLGSCHTRHGR